MLPSPVKQKKRPADADADAPTFEADGLGVVRVKPLGVGGGGVEKSSGAGTAVSVSLTDNSIDVKGKLFSYPSHVVGPDSSQEELYQGYMPRRIQGFLEGLNCNVNSKQTAFFVDVALFNDPECWFSELFVFSHSVDI